MSWNAHGGLSHKIESVTQRRVSLISCLSFPTSPSTEESQSNLQHLSKVCDKVFFCFVKKSQSLTGMSRRDIFRAVCTFSTNFHSWHLSLIDVTTLDWRQGVFFHFIQTRKSSSGLSSGGRELSCFFYDQPHVNRGVIL